MYLLPDSGFSNIYISVRCFYDAEVGTIEILSEIIELKYQVIFVNGNHIARNSATILIVQKKSLWKVFYAI